MFRRSPARWLAPLALVGCAIAVYAVTMSGLGSGDGDPPSAKPAGANPAKRSGTQQSKPSDTTTTPRSTGAQRNYTVRPGDTLVAISTQTGVPLKEIQRLNPSLDSQSLQAGQRVKLSP